MVASPGAGSDFKAEVLGEAHYLPDGNLLVSWGSEGILQILDSDETVLWEAQMALESFVSQVHYLPGPYDVVQ